MSLEVYAIAEMMGEGKVRAFKTFKGARQASLDLGKGDDRFSVEGLMLNDVGWYPHPHPACCVVKGASKAAPPATVFLCCHGCSGCTFALASAHLTLAEAEAAVAKLNATDYDDMGELRGSQAYVCDCDLEP